MNQNATHIWRQRTPNGIVLQSGIYVQTLGFLMLRPKHVRADAELGLYRLMRNVNVEDVYTMYEAEGRGWVAPMRPAFITRDTRVQRTMIA